MEAIFAKKKQQLARLKEDAERFCAKRNRLHTELARLSSERNGLLAELACLRQQQKDATERLSKRFKTVLDNAFAKCLNAAPVLDAAPERTSDEKEEQAPEIALHCNEEQA